ncbi:urease accessory protein UreD [Thalassococcus sp. S3]|uniref:urease accessory protein UreD n=1 Tax=Thalassococcus sp. S3 TaxID=2017482 RepID=UPI001024171F|nr:urease accessory protein UreD [Thalassococcus sp. S3]QBF30599.1 urease accessory protein [Thalassococcus sp. S3]
MTVKSRAPSSVIGALRQQGSLKLLFPRSATDNLTAVLLNTAGGVTGGDRFSTQIEAKAHTDVTVTTQAAERAYRAQEGETGHIETKIDLAPDARMAWLPQETLLYDQAALDRTLSIRMERTSTLLAVEPVVFGRAAMGERLDRLHFRDRIDVVRDGTLIFADRTIIDGRAADQMTRAALGNGAGAMASVIYAAPAAARFLAAARERLPKSCGISALHEDLLYARLLAQDSFALRQILIPLVALLNAHPLPRPWTI